MNQNTTQGNLSDRQINALMAQAINYIADELDGNSNIYDLDNNYTERTRIGHIMLKLYVLYIEPFIKWTRG